MLEWILAALGVGIADAVLNNETDEEREKRRNCYTYYDEFIEYYLDQQRTKIMKRAERYRRDYGYWPRIKNLHYTPKDLEEPEAPDDAVNLSYLGTYDHEEFFKNLKREINFNSLSYESRSGLQEISEEIEALDDFYDKNEGLDND